MKANDDSSELDLDGLATGNVMEGMLTIYKTKVYGTADLNEEQAEQICHTFMAGAVAYRTALRLAKEHASSLDKDLDEAINSMLGTNDEEQA